MIDALLTVATTVITHPLQTIGVLVGGTAVGAGFADWCTR